MTAASNSGKYVDFDEYVGLKLEKTQSTIRMTDVLTAFAGVAAMFLGYLLVFVILDQWVIQGGFNVAWRWVLLSTLMISTISWLAFKVGIPSLRNVNGLFAAQEIEKAQPELKSNLLNLIDLKEAGRKVNPQILKSMERQAAVRLQAIDISQVIDHRPLVHAAYILLAVIVVFCCYALLSPKKISNSIWRGLLPAAQVPLATVTEIIDVKPGDVTIPSHQPVVNVQVDLAGEIPQQVWLLYTTADGKQDQPVEFRIEQEGQPRYIGQIIGDSTQGLTHDLSYFIRAGDATSRTYKITVEQPPYAEVEKLHIEFPAYMKLQTVEQQRSGAIDAWEGAKVTLTAKTNMPVRSGVIQFLDDPAAAPTGEEVPMSTSQQGTQLQATWTLALRSDGTYPKCYRIHCKTEDGRVTTGHVILPQTIRPDLPPEVVLLQPDRDLEAPANATIPLLIQARDPDFEMGYVYLNVEKGGVKVLRDKISEGHQSKLSLKHDLELSPFNPVVGETLEFWIEAYDNKQPRPNSRNTPKITVQIVAPVSQKEADKQLADQKDQRDQKLADAEQDMNSDRRDPAQPGEGNQQERKARDAARPNEAEPARPEDGNQDEQQGGQQGAGQQSKKQNPKGNQGQDQGQGAQNGGQRGDGQNSQPGSENQPGEGANQSKPLKNDGSQDDEAIRRISDRIKKNQAQKPGDSSDESSPDGQQREATGKGDKPQKESAKNDSTQKDQTSKGGKNSSGKQDSAKNQAGDSPEDEGQQKTAEDGNQSKGQPNGEPSSKRDDGDRSTNKPEMNNPEKGDKNNTDPKSDSASKNDKDPDGKSDAIKPGEKGNKSEDQKPNGQSADKREDGDRSSNKPEMNNSDKNDKNSAESKGLSEAKDDKNPDSKPQMNKQGEKGEAPQTSNTDSEKAKSDQGEASDKNDSNGKQGNPDASNPKNPNGSKPGAQSQQDKGNNPSEEQPKNEGGEQSQVDKPQSKPSKDDSSSGSKQKPAKQDPSGKSDSGKSNSEQSDPSSNPKGSKEQAPDSPNSKKGTPDGTEEGVAKPQRDPNPKADPSMNDKVKRDPNEKPEVRPGDSTSDPADKPKDGPSEASNPGKKQGQKQGQQSESSDMKNGESATSKSQQNESADSEDSTSGDNSKRQPSGNNQEKIPKDSSESENGGETGSKKPDSTQGEKKETGKPKPESKPDENAGGKEPGDNEKGGQKSKSGAGKLDKQKPSGDSSNQEPTDQKNSSDKPMNDKPSNQKSPKDKGAGDKPQSADSQKEQGDGDKKGGSKSDKKSGDQDKSGSKSDKGDKGGNESGKDDSGKSGSEGSDSKDGNGDKPGEESGKGKSPSKPGTKNGPAGQTGGVGNQGESIQTRGGDTPEPSQSEDANLEYNRQATELILQKLKKDLERGEADPELLKELGWTPDEMKKFADRLSKSLNESKQVEESPEGKARQQQFQEMLKNLDLKSAGNRRSGEDDPKRDVQQIESKRSQPPAAYRSVFEKFTKDAARTKTPPKEPSSK